MIGAELKIPQMFSAYAEDKGYINVEGCHIGWATAYSGLHHYQYFCEECDQVFSSAWGRIQGSMNYSERGSYFHCPHCGKTHRNNVVYINHKEIAPYKVRLVVKAFDSVVLFEVYSKTVEFQDYLKVVGGTYKEVFRFDIAKQTALFTAYDNGIKKEPVEFGHPFKPDALDGSILRFFRPNSLANSNNKSDLIQILRVLRETVHRQLEKWLGHKIASMYVSPGQNYGSFLLPIFNIGYRLLCPDAPNLPAVYRENLNSIKKYWKSKMISEDTTYMNQVIEQRRKVSYVKALISVHSLPNTPSIRKALAGNPFDVELLDQAFKLCSNYDYVIQMFECFQEISAVSEEQINKSLINFLRTMKGLYGEVGIVRMAKNFQEIQLWDCMRLYRQLNKENRKALKTESVRLRDLHDWMSLRHKKQMHKNLKFDVPDHIVKRLSVQRSRLKFFLPEESMQLLEAGHELHNCIASYGTHMKDNKLWIVLVSDDKGKLTACLEIKENELVQAKSDRNKPASANAELNDAILAWVKEANIKIKTLDVKESSEKKSRKKVSA